MAFPALLLTTKRSCHSFVAQRVSSYFVFVCKDNQTILFRGEDRKLKSTHWIGGGVDDSLQVLLPSPCVFWRVIHCATYMAPEIMLEAQVCYSSGWQL